MNSTKTTSQYIINHEIVTSTVLTVILPVIHLHKERLETEYASTNTLNRSKIEQQDQMMSPNNTR